ncbi:MAG TPA: type II toxin-antitoxin system VapC family toxin [Terracidiphilus sp.]
MKIYADSSFLVSTCVYDAHTAETALRMANHPFVSITIFNRAEVANATHRYVYRGAITAADALSAWNHFEQDCANGIWTLVGLPERIWNTSIDLTRRHGPTLGVRTLDSLHVACALELKAERFWTFDDRQARLAEAVGLETNA